MRIETNEDLAAAKMRLARRTHESLAQFIVSLAFDTGPAGEQVRTFIVGEDIELTAASLKQRIEQLRDLEPRGFEKRFGDLVAQRLHYMLDAIETQVLPTNAQFAFDLLVLLIEHDGDAMENSGDYDYCVAVALRRAAELVAKTAQTLPEARVKQTLEQLVAEDGYGTRGSLRAMVDAQWPDVNRR
jgi:hypothetical protein